MFFSNKKLIGIDLGSSMIKAAEINFSGKKAELVGFSMTPTPEGAMVGGEIQQPGLLSEVIQSLVADLHSKRKQAAIGLWGTSVVVKKISIPRIEEKLIAGQIRWEAEQYIPFDIEDVNIDYKILKDLSVAPETMDILLVAAKKDAIYMCQDTLQGAGLAPAVIDLSSFALANCVQRNHPEISQMTVAVMDMGASVTNFMVLEKGEVIFYRDIPVGGLTYTSEIQKSMNVSYEEAESLKLGASDSGANPDELLTAIKYGHDMVSEEIQNSIEFFMNTTPGIQIQKILYSGGGSRTFKCISEISAKTNLPMEKINIFNYISSKAGSFTAEFLEEVDQVGAVAMGLALRKVGDT
ncbi:MAG TPA: fimbrial assembly protein [Bdellovibrionales bacterium]|nr:fimbrial assembly protein [Pseudobdellovibrionaceae bacterium]HAG91940.1 fimbrial assembly protein [Bdellovibrionales bacterium]|tara:strand:- start:3203 stop:4258 length:1056 start_codon:yes stop_codon:yes gene_type:complete